MEKIKKASKVLSLCTIDVEPHMRLAEGERTRRRIPLLKFADEGDDIACAILLSAGADVNQGDRRGSTALMRARRPSLPEGFR